MALFARIAKLQAQRAMVAAASSDDASGAFAGASSEGRLVEGSQAASLGTEAHSDDERGGSESTRTAALHQCW